MENSNCGTVLQNNSVYVNLFFSRTHILVVQDQFEDLLSLSHTLQETKHGEFLSDAVILCKSYIFTFIPTYRLVDVEPGGHPPENSRVQVLRTVRGSHYDYLTQTE